MAAVIATHHVISPSISFIMEFSGSPVCMPEFRGQSSGDIMLNSGVDPDRPASETLNKLAPAGRPVRKAGNGTRANPRPIQKVSCVQDLTYETHGKANCAQFDVSVSVLDMGKLIASRFPSLRRG